MNKLSALLAASFLLYGCTSVQETGCHFTGEIQNQRNLSGQSTMTSGGYFSSVPTLIEKKYYLYQCDSGPVWSVTKPL